MKIINKQNFKINDINGWNITLHPFTEWAVLSDDIQLTKTDGDENIIQLYPLQYRKGLNYSTSHYQYKHLTYDICNEIIMMTAQERSVVDAEIALKEEIASFKGHCYRLTADISIMNINSPFRYLYDLGVTENAERVINYNEGTGKPVTITSLWKELKSPFKEIILANSNIFKLEICPNK